MFEQLAIIAIDNERRVIPGIQNFLEIVDRWDDIEFQRNFRLHRSSFDYILNLIRPSIVRQGVFGRHPIAPRRQLMIVLWLMATPESYCSVCGGFGVGKATGFRAMRRVTNALYRLSPFFIKWPTPVQARAAMRSFQAKMGFPRVIGAIDGTHIHIPKPRHNHESYINRKKYHSIIMQAVCDHNRRFIHVYVGEVGSVHDSRVLRRSDLAKFYIEGKFPDDSHILSDGAYAINKDIPTPFRNNFNLNVQQRNYNYCHSSTRIIIEQAFGRLKIILRRVLDKLPMFKTDLIPRFVMALCVIHNIHINHNDIHNFHFHANEDHLLPIGDEHRLEGVQKRMNIMRNLPFRLQV